MGIDVKYYIALFEEGLQVDFTLLLRISRRNWDYRVVVQGDVVIKVDITLFIVSIKFMRERYA